MSYAIEPGGDPLFYISELAEHTRNLRADGRASLLATEPLPHDVDPLSLGRVTLIGTARPVHDDELADARALVIERHPAVAGYADYGDFACWRLVVNAVRWVGGFGRMNWIDADAYRKAIPDPVLTGRHGIIVHMNDDHADAGVLLCQRAVDAAGHNGVEVIECLARGSRSLRLRLRRIDECRFGLHPGRIRGAGRLAGRGPRRRCRAGAPRASLMSRARLVASLFIAGIVAASFGSPAGSAPPTSEPTAASIAAEFPPVADASRIIPVNGDLAEVVYALGLGDRVVATDISATYPEAAEDTPKVGYQRTLTAETILSFEPTVVLADDRAGPVEVFDQLRAAGVDVVIVEHRADIESPAYKIRAVASTLDAVDAGERLVDEFERELDDGRDIAAAGIAAGGRPLVLALYLRGGAVQLVFGTGSGIDAVVEAAGGNNAGSEMGINDFAELSIEAMVEAAPEYLLVTTTGLESVGGVEGLSSIPGIAETPAGEAGNVLVFEDQFLYGLGPRTGELVAELAAQLHPPTD